MAEVEARAYGDWRWALMFWPVWWYQLWTHVAQANPFLGGTHEAVHPPQNAE